MRREQRDITDFLTDGSLAGLCAAAQRLTGVPIALRDAEGGVVAGDAPRSPSSDEFTAPLRIHAGPIGSLVVPNPVEGAGAPTDEVRTFLTLLASVVGEICDRDVEVHERLAELGALYKLSSMLVGVSGIERLLSAGIEMAVAVLGVDAGAIRLLAADGAALELAATSGLSDRYTAQTHAVPSDVALDAEALAGGAVLVEDILRKGKPIHPEAMEAEGLRSMLSAGLVFRGETLGVVRLFSRSPRTFTRSEERLTLSIAQQLAAALASARLIESEARNEEINRQVRLARDVQRRMMPDESVEYPGLDVAARYLSSSELGGDFFDCFRTAQGLAVVVGDVVGKGVAAAMLMSSVRATIRTLIDTGHRVADAMSRANQALTRDTQVHEFATAFAGIINPAAGAVEYVSAGHEPTLLVRAGAADVADIIELTAGGMLMGVEAGEAYEPGVVRLHPGDTLIACTDGLTEAMNFENALFTRKRLKHAIIQTLGEDPGASAERLADQILWSMRCFTGVREQTDDVTLVVVRVRG
ncbi:MAG: SpoIIE family protein phosphatase [Phycisphaeraceae bacterium]|nr:SpoIIE family protein phosphatase [Phycisphaeraceae bacterium]MCB9847225.1 SpoIIE family protein phosphatase [Phycisphaeraceae bacterium]